MSPERRAVLNAIIVGQTDPNRIRCGPDCVARAEPTTPDGQDPRPEEGLAPRPCPTVSWHIIWLYNRGLITYDADGDDTGTDCLCPSASWCSRPEPTRDGASTVPDVPPHVDVGPHRVTIDATETTARLLRDEDSRGDTRFDQLLVRIDAQRPHTAAAETLLHELLHCCWNGSALRSLEVDEEQELVVTALSPVLLDVLRRNPDIVAYLTAD